GAGVPATTAGASASGESGESTLGVSSTSAAGTTGDGTSGTSAGATSEASTSAGDTDTTGGCTFLWDPDAPSDTNNPDDCDPFVQDCPEGEKCSPTAEESAGWYYETVCNPIPRDPKKVGEPCSVEESTYSGIDDCEEGAMCWRVDSETLTGTCIAL